VPKLKSLELFNPETDDLDSDSSDEPSSPDSIDSVINALQTQSTDSQTEPLLGNNSSSISTSHTISSTTKSTTHAHEVISNRSKKSIKCPNSLPTLVETNASAVMASKPDDAIQVVGINERKMSDESNGDIIINKNDINLNVTLTNQQQMISDTSGNTKSDKNQHNDNLKSVHNNNSDKPSDNLENCKEHLVDFAEKLSAQLMKELNNAEFEEGNDDDNDDDFDAFREEFNDRDGFENDFCVDDNDSNADSTFCVDSYLKKINGDIQNLGMLRDELRERRLMLANLSSKSSSTTSSKLSHDIESQDHMNSSVNAQELLEDDSPPLSAKIQSHLSQNPNLITNLGTPQSVKKQQQKINDFILEENEENEEDESSRADEDSSSRLSFNLSYNASCSNNNNCTNDTALLLQEDSFEENDNSSSIGLQQMKQNLLKNIKYPSKHNNGGGNNNDSNNNSNTNSCDSWANSTSASLDSPSVGGSATHHVFHHVFREGELDALINKHVGNLHIVSSYYERASWCVVCEKVQVWTI
jgi:hypothetical protein